MKKQSGRKIRAKKQLKQTCATVEYASIRQIWLRKDDGELLKFSAADFPALLPGDRVSDSNGLRRELSPFNPDSLSVESRGVCQVVLRVRHNVSRLTHTLEPIGLFVPGRVESSENLQSIDNGQFLVATLKRKPTRRRRGIVWELSSIDQILDNQCNVATAVALTRFGIRENWPKRIKTDLDDVALVCTKSEVINRKDLRDLAFVTIDPAEARDHDDAVYCERSEHDGYRLWVAIADVAHYVKPGTLLDAEAFKRGASIYFPCQSIPMLPSELSSEACSLKPDLDRLALVCEMAVSSNGTVDSYKFYEAVIRSRARLTYEEVGNSGINGTRTQEVSNNIQRLFELHETFMVARKTRGALNLDIPAPSINFDSSGAVADVSKDQKFLSHSLIEEAMLAANTCAAKFIAEHYPNAGMYRVHGPPKESNLQFINQMLSDSGLSHKLTSESTLVHCQIVTEQLRRQSPTLYSAFQIHLLRSLEMAIYSSKNGSHFALNYPEYTHFTSPIRRYPDLVVHRMIKRVLNDTGDNPEESVLTSLAEQSSRTERRAESCARDAESWLKAELMKSRVGERFDAVVTDCRHFGVFVQLDSPYVDGMIHVSDLGYEYFSYEESSRNLVSDRTGKRFCIGDSLKVRVAGADPELGHVNFELA